MYKVLLDSDNYLLSYSALINPLEPDTHHMTSQILSIFIDFYPDLCIIFSIIFPIFRPLQLWNEKRYQETVNDNVPDFSRNFR